MNAPSSEEHVDGRVSVIHAAHLSFPYQTQINIEVDISIRIVYVLKGFICIESVNLCV